MQKSTLISLQSMDQINNKIMSIYDHDQAQIYVKLNLNYKCMSKSNLLIIGNSVLNVNNYDVN